MAVIFSDAFASGTNPDTTYWTEDIGTWALASTMLNCSGSGAQFNFCSTKTAAHALIADVKLTVTRKVGGSFDAGPLVRATGVTTALNGYYLDVSDGAGAANLYRRVAGSDTLVTSFTFTNANNDIYAIKVTGVGATVTFQVFKNGSQVDTDKTDTNAARIVAAGRTGVISWNGSAIFDDFSVDDLLTPLAPIAVTVLQAVNRSHYF